MQRPIPLESAVELLISIIEDPKNSSSCCVMLGLAADRIDQALDAGVPISEKIKLVKSYPKLLRAGIRFLTENRSLEEHTALIQHLARPCQCDLKNASLKRWHNPTRRRRDGRSRVYAMDFIFDAVSTICSCIVLVVADMTQHKFHTGQTNKGELRWPQGPEDLLPFGPDNSANGLERWVSSPPYGWAIFELTGRLALFHAPFARAVFQIPDAESMHKLSVYWPFYHLGQAIKFYRQGDSSVEAHFWFFELPVIVIFQFFAHLSDVEPYLVNTMFVLRGEQLAPTLERLSSILALLPVAVWSKTRMRLQYLIFCAKAKLDTDTGIAIVAMDLPDPTLFDELEDAFTLIVRSRRKGCWNMTCPSSSEVVHSRLCSKCDLLRFCNEKCQKEAWKSRELPHKFLCPKIHALKNTLGADNWSRLWTLGFPYSKFQELCKSTGVDVEVVKEIYRILISLTGRKFALIEKNVEAEIDRLGK